MTRRFARCLTVALVALLFFGTLMPGHWKDSAAAPLHSAVDISMLAHVTLFAAICLMVPFARFWDVKSWHLPVLGLFLALLTEGLQFFAIDRHPNLAGVFQDMAGAFMGWAMHGVLALPMAATLRARIAPPPDLCDLRD